MPIEDQDMIVEKIFSFMMSIVDSLINNNLVPMVIDIDVENTMTSWRSKNNNNNMSTKSSFNLS